MLIRIGPIKTRIEEFNKELNQVDYFSGKHVIDKYLVCRFLRDFSAGLVCIAWFVILMTIFIVKLSK